MTEKLYESIVLMAFELNCIPPVDCVCMYIYCVYMSKLINVLACLIWHLQTFECVL